MYSGRLTGVGVVIRVTGGGDVADVDTVVTVSVGFSVSEDVRVSVEFVWPSVIVAGEVPAVDVAVGGSEVVTVDGVDDGLVGVILMTSLTTA